MPRISTLTPEQMSSEQRRVHDDIMAGPRGRLGGPFQAWLRSPALADRAQKLGEHLRFKSALPPRLSELAILLTARHWTAQFEWYAHAPMARDAGLADEVIEAVRQRRRPSFEREDEAVLYDFCVELYESCRVGEATYQRAVTHLSEQGVVDLVGILGYYALVSMTLNVFETPLPEGVSPPLT
ncbi:MAG: carboxymuconolactone decarboxylase family protein [Alphaproteobacteria bacterium]|nr:carboxymuconolactone decarboxylase family protein [Alphaproteobacteria bacterium]MDP6813837.1 carboxymuconolactone decarboxylase family protein [Alphaproteobacteria bacterium]